jgi:hypothetical protein
MADLTIVEKRQFERLLDMGGGYVLNFSDRTMAEFVADSVHRDLYGGAYNYASCSKANMLRGFWKVESNRVVGKLLNDLINYAVAERRVKPDNPDLDACRRTVARLSQDSPVPELDALTAESDERDFEIVAKAVRAAIEQNEPETGLDRLHTFAMKFFRSVCTARGIDTSREKPLHSLVGEYIKSLRQAGHIETEMTERILRSSISVFDAFNDVRNNRSLAHDNAVLSYEEALLIFNHVTASIRFVRALEEKLAKPATRERQRR